MNDLAQFYDEKDLHNNVEGMDSLAPTGLSYYSQLAIMIYIYIA